MGHRWGIIGYAKLSGRGDNIAILVSKIDIESGGSLIEERRDDIGIISRTISDEPVFDPIYRIFSLRMISAISKIALNIGI